jgi:hypothetical protein
MGKYGAHFWLNAGDSHNTSNRHLPLLPPDAFYASGFEGQTVMIVPTAKLVVAQLALDRQPPTDQDNCLQQFFHNVLKSLPALQVEAARV